MKLDCLKRLNYIEGHIKGIRKMIADGKKYPEIIHQITAVRASLDGAIVLVTATDAVIYEPESDRGFQVLGEIALMVPLTPLITKMQRHVLPIAPVSAQATLPFPPEVVKNRA